MVKKKVNLLCFDLVIRTPDVAEPRVVENIKIIGKKSDAFKYETILPYLDNPTVEAGFPINIHFEKWQFEMDENKFMQVADVKTKIEKEKENELCL